MNCKMIFAALTLLLAASADLAAQSAPKPSGLAAAKSVFISLQPDHDGVVYPNAYDDFYADLQQLNRFTIVLDPAQADLILELKASAASYTMSILDAKSHFILWSLNEQVQAANRTATFVKNQHQAVLNLVGDLKQLCLPATATVR